MVSPQDSHSNPSHLPTTPPFYSPSSVSCTKIQRSLGRSMRTVRSNLYQTNHNTCSFPGAAPPKSASACVSENLTDSVVDLRLGELAGRTNKSVNSSSSDTDFFDLSQAFSDFSVCSSDISGELQRLATIPAPENLSDPNPQPVSEPCAGFLDRDNFSTEIIESISPEDLQPTVKICIDGLRSPSTAVKRSAAAKLRLLAKNRSDNRALIGESGAVPALIPLLRCTDPMTQEHAVTALLNLSLLEENKARITSYGAIKALIYVLKTGTETSKQNAACALLNLSLIDENKISIGACGAIPPLITLLMNGSNRGKKDAMTTLYKLCTVKVNKERAVKALYYCYLVRNELASCREECKVLQERLTCSEENVKLEKNYSMEKSLENDMLRNELKVADEQCKKSVEDLKLKLQMLASEHHHACVEVEKLQMELSVLNEEKEDLLNQVRELDEGSVLIDDFQLSSWLYTKFLKTSFLLLQRKGIS